MKRLIKTFNRIGLTGNVEKPEFGPLVRQAVRLVQSTGRTVACDAESARAAGLKIKRYQDTKDLTDAVDLLLVLGGDGTLLRVARQVAGSSTPILGINIGGLGFLTPVSSAELEHSLESVWQGEFTLETRTLISARVNARANSISQDALNDFVIVRGTTPRLIELEVIVNDELLTRYRCDGLIVSSPTGSTAYSLAAGGPIVCPTASVFALTPICPHTLSNRSVIAGLASTIQVRVVSAKLACIFSADGQVVSELGQGDTVVIQQSDRAVRLMHLPGTSFFETLRRKLHWRGASV